MGILKHSTPSGLLWIRLLQIDVTMRHREELQEEEVVDVGTTNVL